VDGLIFVCDSQWEKIREDLESFRNLQANLASYGYSLDNVPYAIQYNKRDLSNISQINYLEFVINQARVPSFEVCALDGRNVFESLNCVCSQVLANLRSKQQEGAL
jgi:mutual gliding-motility protein MglA